jgi:hypothetical protein
MMLSERAYEFKTKIVCCVALSHKIVKYHIKNAMDIPNKESIAFFYGR